MSGFHGIPGIRNCRARAAWWTGILLIGIGVARGADGLAPREAVASMKLPPGFNARLVASEPQIRQPLSITFDERGRMWIIQYLQYPHPAGLKAIEVDQYLRTKYDRLPEPPPRGPRGADKITICEDTDGDGVADKFTDFVTGLNLCSGMALGRGGVFVVQPPYLLFYPDKNRDDKPDGDPEVLLTGFGMEDAHAFANSLTWGPDGWLYGAQGSTVTANIRGIEFQQGIWRYHPVTREFELFAEGGGNTWGLDFDEDGNVIAGTNFGNDIALHQVQGGNYVKNFGKHGELHNPHAYGYFGHIPYTGFRGGHVTCGGIIYQGGSFPKEFEGTYIAANLLANSIYWHVLEPAGSSFRGHFGGTLMETDDHWFRPVDCAVGPDGSVYVADWCDKRATHVDPKDDWDRSNGRIFKIEADGTRPVKRFDLGKMSSSELVGLLSNKNDFFVREARRILGERRDPAVYPRLKENISDAKNPHLALESLWALYASGGFDESASKYLAHSNPRIREWTVRFLGEESVNKRTTFKLTREIDEKIEALARLETDPGVRRQLACSAKRFSAPVALRLFQQLVVHHDDSMDPQIPLLLWWALEAMAISEREQVLEMFDEKSFWNAPVVGKFIVERLARRYAAEGTRDGFESCARLLARAPEAVGRNLCLTGLEKAWEGRVPEKVSAGLEKLLTAMWSEDPGNPILLRLAVRLGNAEGRRAALSAMASKDLAEADRIALIQALSESGANEAVPEFFKLLRPGAPSRIQLAVLSALPHFSDASIADRVLEKYPSASGDLRKSMRNLLVSRPAWAQTTMRAIEKRELESKDFSLDQIRRISMHRDPGLIAAVEKIWGKAQPETAGEKRARIGGIVSILHMGTSDAVKGRALFQQACAVCHTLFGEGKQIGPDLTGVDRKNLDFLLSSIVDPSGYIRAEYVSYNLTTRDDRVLAGLIAEQSPETVTILDAANQRTTVPRSAIKELSASGVSLMPEGILDALEPQQIRDLMAYLQGEGTK